LNRLLETYGTGRKTRILVTYLSVSATLGLVAAARSLTTGTYPEISELLLLALLGFAGHHIQVALPQGTFISLCDPLALAALWCFGLPSALLVLVPGSLALFFTKKKALLNCLFNAGQFSLSAIGAASAVSLLRRVPGLADGPGSVFSVAAMSLVFDAVNNGLVAGAVALDQELPWRDAFLRMWYTDRKNSLVFLHFVNMTGALLTFYMGEAGALFVAAGILALWAQLQFEREFARKAHEAQTDGLTGLLNVRYLDNWMGSEFTRLAKRDQTCSLVFVDVDGLKQVNDTYGHDAGDALLVHLAGILRTVTRAEDRVVRYGGDEFVLICLKADQQDAVRIGQRVLDAVKRQPLVHEGRTLTYGLSIGVASFPKHSAYGQDLVRMADKAMYLAKKQGGNIVFTADSL